MKSLYDLVWGQCTKAMKAKIKACSKYQDFYTSGDSLALLKAIRAEITRFVQRQCIPHAVHKVMKDFYTLGQGKYKSYLEYLEEFNLFMPMATKGGANIDIHPSIVSETIKNHK